MVRRISDRIQAAMEDPSVVKSIDGFLEELIKNLRELDAKVERLIFQFIFYILDLNL